MVVEDELAERAMGLLHRGLRPNRAARVCSTVRVVLALKPISLTSLNSHAHLLLADAGGPPGRNWSAEARLKGRIRPR